MDATKVKARDLMQANVAKLDVDTPVDEAISLLEADRISGAPVVDAAGRVVGVLIDASNCNADAAALGCVAA